MQHMFEKQVFVCMCEHSLEEGRWQHTPIQTHKYTQGECVAVCCSVLQCVAVYCNVLQQSRRERLVQGQCITMKCSTLQCDAVCCSVFQPSAAAYSRAVCCSQM